MTTEDGEDPGLPRAPVARGGWWVWLALGCMWTGCGPSRTLNAVGSRQAQAPTRNAASAPDDSRELGEFLLLRKDGERIEGRDGSLSAARLTGSTADGKQLDVLREDIKTLYRKEGSRAGTLALAGAGTGLLVSGLIVLRVHVDNSDVFRDDRATAVSAAVIGGGTLLGALIGLAVGAGENDWRVEPLVSADQEYSVQLTLPL
ncbi:hypothetical protein HPC49_09800 [Pyxidicoccus fallax]|uniref:Uncharacterized protein n=1 Tax=Pyxidicoccus fallax TaxID=394095 RepID=A0A848L5G0_9BACT|nr:hypothetical protein [Pyxidicoccus fallax]NMO13512.1 hypothetical protein [Pyxidicoccus fallax]NPC78537.1 hypothetical protein [Pyxidicoccus fallax]